MSFSSPAGWYPDPDGSGRQRFWDGENWTEALAAAVPTGPPPDATRTWAMAAHWSALPAALVLLAFLGPLLVLRTRGRTDPYVRDHAVEALNFNLAVFLVWVVGGLAAYLGLGLVALASFVAVVGFAWLAIVIRAWVKAGRGERYRYPLTIRFVS